MSEYPESERRAAVHDKIVIITEFMDWLRGQGVVQAVWQQQHKGVDAQLMPEYVPIEKRLADYFDYDLKKIDDEHRLMLERIRAANVADGH